MGSACPPCPGCIAVADAVALIRTLTPRELEVLQLLSAGCTIKKTAQLLGIEWFTVNDHRKSLYRKLHVSTVAEAAVKACRGGVV